MSRDYICLSDHQSHCLLISLLPCSIHKLHVCDLIKDNNDIQYVYVELSHSDKADDELSVVGVEPEEGLDGEVLSNGNQRVEVKEVYFFCHEALDDGLDLPV